MKLNDLLVIQTKSTLSYEEIKSLSLLYLPLIGKMGVSTYFALYSLCNLNSSVSEEISLTTIKSILDTTVKECREVINKMSAVGLVSLYEKELDNHSLWLIILNKPLDASEFKESLLLRNTFASKLNLKNAQLVLDYFKISDKYNLKEFNLRSKEFFNEFTYNVPVEFKSNHPLRGGKNKKLPDVSSYFDYQLFLELLPDDVIYENTQLLDNNHYIENLKMLAFSYELSESELVEVYIRAYEKNNSPIISDLTLEAKNYVKDDVSSPQQELPSINEKLLSTTPIKLLLNVYSSTKNIPVTPLDIEHANLFYIEHSEVNKVYLAISVLYTLRLKKEVPTPNYLKTVLTGFQTKYHSPTELINYFILFDTTKQTNLKKRGYGKSRDDKVKRNSWIDEVRSQIAEENGD